MGLLVLGEVLKTGDQNATPPTFFHRFTPNYFMELKAIQSWVVKHGAPTCDGISLGLYAMASVFGERRLIAQSNTSWQVSEVSSSTYAVKQLYFNFDNAILLRKDTEYAVSLLLENYTGDDDNHIAWVRDWPDPVTSFAGEADLNSLNTYPFRFGIIGREVRP